MEFQEIDNWNIIMDTLLDTFVMGRYERETMII